MTRRLALVVVLSACAAFAAAPATAGALSYSKAKRVALRTLKPERYDGPIVLFGLSRPVSSRSRVFEAAKVPHQNLKRIGKRSYLFWLDKAPGAMFEHPSRLLLVSASNGRVVRRQNYTWWPLVDGKRPAFLASVKNYGGTRYVVYESDSARQYRAPKAKLPATVRDAGTGGSLQNTCMVLVDDQRDPLLQPSVNAYRGLAIKLGIPVREVSSGLALDDALTALQGGGCKSVLLSIVAHGASARSSPSYPSVRLFGPPGRSGAIIRPQETDLDGPYVANILDSHKGLGYSVTVTSCFSGRWLTYLDGDTRLTGRIRVIATSSGPDEVTVGVRIPGVPTFFDQGFVPAIEADYIPSPGGGVSGPSIEQAVVDGYGGGYATARTTSTPRLSDHVKGTISIAFSIFGDFADDVQDESRPWGTGSVTATSSDGDPPKTIVNGRVANDAGEFGPYHPGATVTLTPTADRGSHFAGWGGQCQGAGATCVLQNLFGAGKIPAAAHFAVTSYVVTVQNDDGGGYVYAKSGPLECGTSLGDTYNYCSERVHAARSDDDLFALNARADDASPHHFVSFEGCDSVLLQPHDDRYATCYLEVNSDRTVKATFAAGP